MPYVCCAMYDWWSVRVPSCAYGTFAMLHSWPRVPGVIITKWGVIRDSKRGGDSYLVGCRGTYLLYTDMGCRVCDKTCLSQAHDRSGAGVQRRRKWAPITATGNDLHSFSCRKASSLLPTVLKPGKNVARCNRLSMGILYLHRALRTVCILQTLVSSVPFELHQMVK